MDEKSKKLSLFTHWYTLMAAKSNPMAVVVVYLYEVVQENSYNVTVVTASVKENEKGGQGHTF